MKTKYLIIFLLIAAMSPCALKAQTNSCVIDSFPWTEDFNSYYNGYFDPQDGPCWSYESLNDVNRHFQIDNGVLYLPHGTSNLINGTYAALKLPQLSLPSENYAFSLSVYREAETNGYVEVFASPNGNISNLEPIGYIYTKYNFDGDYWDHHTRGMVPPENGAGWYTYSFNIPYSGSCYIVVCCMSDWYRESPTPKNVYIDNFCIREVPSGLTVSNITSTSADISWTPATDETEWIVQYGTHNAFYNGTFQQVTVTGTPSITLTSLDPVQRYHVRVKAVYGSEKSGWSLPLSFEMLPRYTVGQLDDTYRLLPTCSHDSYRFTQQIYTADELGEACTIRSIEFFMSSETPCNRNLDVYLVPTSKESFESTGDWISVTSADRVFSGMVNFSRNDWTVLELQSPFDYDGQHNLALIVDDNTGYEQPYAWFNIMSTTTHQGNSSSIYQTNVNPSSPGEGYLILKKNQLRLFKDFPPPSNLHCTATSATSATVDWTENSEFDTWQICINDDEANLITVNSSNKPYTLTGLTPDTQYSVKVRSQHENGLFSSWSYNFNFGTATPLPYSTGFETECDWTLVNGGCINQWFWGTAAYNGEGTHGLYISNDGGTTNAYNSERSATVYAYKTFDMEAGNYELSYDWLANGQNYHDFMRVALVPATVSLEASTLLPEDFDYDALPESWIALDGGSQLNKVTEWQTANYDFEVTAAGFYNLVFAWRNNFFSGTNPPAAIDNVSVETTTCLVPGNLTVSNVGTTSADLSWAAWPDVESYTVKYLNTGIIFTEGFENGLDDWTLYNCADATGVSSLNAHSGNASFLFFYNTNPPQYLISPELSGVTEGMRLEFYYRNQSTEYPETFQVGFSATNNEIVSFSFGDEITASDMQWHLYSETIPIGTKYICWKLCSYDQEFLFIDDIVVGIDAPAFEWQTATMAGNATEVGTTLTSLIPGFQYEAYVYPDCAPYKVSETVYFLTEPEVMPQPFYATKFENGCDWTLVNGGLTNAWTWGTAAHNGNGTHGLYISNDGGTTNAYDNSENTMVYAYKTIDFEAGVYSFSYDWLAQGENKYDFMRAALVPESVILEASTSCPTGFTYNTLPDGWIAIDGGSQLNLATEWQTESNDIMLSEAGTYQMVFAWCNDYSVGTNPPAAIDNVIIDISTCPAPVNLTADNITPTSAELNWNSLIDVDVYTVRYKATQNIVLSEGFEDGLDEWTLRDCDGNTGVTNDSPYSGQNAFYFFYNTNPPQYLISPELKGVGEGLILEFYYRNKYANYPETFQIGFSSTDNATGSFTFGDEITASDTQWHLYSEPVPAGTKYICWKLTSNDKYVLFIDDIFVGADLPASEWQTVTTTTSSITLTGLTPSTVYEAYVYPDCNPDNVSETVFFVTEAANTVTQTLTLSEGWNWVSLYVEGDPIDLLQALESALAENATQISSAELFTENDEGDWWGDLDEEGVTNEQMYMILVENACTITLQGNTANPANPADHAITINPGWNWIGFPCDHEMTIEEALGGFDAEDGDVFANSENFTEFDGEWFGDVETLLPGQGFMYFSNSNEPKTLIIGSSKGIILKR